MTTPRDPIDTSRFATQVMRAVAQQPRPTPSRAFARALRDRSASDALAALQTAWHLATLRSWSVAPSMRVRSMALVVGVVMALGGGSLVAARTAQVVADIAIHRFDTDQTDADARDEPPPSAPSRDDATITVDGPFSTDRDDRAGADPVDRHAADDADDADGTDARPTPPSADTHEPPTGDDAGSQDEPGADEGSPGGGDDGSDATDPDDHASGGSPATEAPDTTEAPEPTGDGDDTPTDAPPAGDASPNEGGD